MKAADYFSLFSSCLQATEISSGDGAALPLEEGAAAVVELILSVRAAGNKVMVIGNGGSAAIASHMHNDLSKMVGAKALTFHETPLLTALSNDEDYTVALEYQAKIWSTPGDLLIAISSSGQSENILRTATVCLARECSLVTLSGFKPENPLRQLGHYNFYVPSREYGFVECAHQVLVHYLTDTASAAGKSFN